MRYQLARLKVPLGTPEIAWRRANCLIYPKLGSFAFNRSATLLAVVDLDVATGEDIFQSVFRKSIVAMSELAQVS